MLLKFDLVHVSYGLSYEDKADRKREIVELTLPLRTKSGGTLYLDDKYARVVLMALSGWCESMPIRIWDELNLETCAYGHPL